MKLPRLAAIVTISTIPLTSLEVALVHVLAHLDVYGNDDLFYGKKTKGQRLRHGDTHP